MKPTHSNRLLFTLRRFLSTPAIFVSFLGAAHAADQTYLDASLLDTWNLADANWSPGPQWVDNNNAIFAGTGEAVTVTAVTPNGITFNSSGYTLSSGTITLGQATTPIAANSDAVINSVLAGSGNGFSKSGNGVLALGGANTFNGLIDVDAGTLKLGIASGLGTGSVSVAVAPGATLDIGGFNAGARPIFIAGTGVGGVGAIYNSSTTTGAVVGAITLDADASIANAYPTADNSKTLTTGTLNLGGNKLTISDGVIATTMQNIASGDIDINSGGVLYYTNGGSLTNVTGTITVKTGGRLDTRDSNNTGVTSTHTIALNGGILSNGGIANNNGGGAGATLKNDITVDATNGGTISAVSSGFGLSIKLAGSVSGSGALTITNNAVEFRGDTSGYIGTATATGGTITFNPTPATQVFNGILAGSRPLTKSGANTTTLNGNNTYSGTTTVSGGTLVLTGSNTGTGATAVNAGTTLRLDYGTNNNRKISSGALTLSGGTIELSGGSLFTDSVASTAVTSGTISTITRSSGTNILDLKAITPNTGRINFAQSGIAKTTNANNAQGNLGSWATIGGTAFAKNDGTGLIVEVPSTTDVTRLSTIAQSIADNSAADVRITEGTGTAANIGLAAATTTINSLNQSAVGGNSPAIIDPAGQTLAVNGIMIGSGAGSLTIGTGTNNGTLRSAGTALAFRDLANAGITVNSDIVNGTGASTLTKFDTSTLTLGGANSYTGGTIVNDGTLRLGSSSALPSTGTVTLNNAATLDLNDFGASAPTLAGAATSTVTDNSAGFGTTTLALTNASGTVPNKFVNGANKAVALRITNENTSFALNNASSTFSGGVTLTNSTLGTRMQTGTVTAGAYGTGAITVGEAPTDKAGIFLNTANQTLANPVISNTNLGTDRVGTFRVATTGITLSGQLTANLAPMTFSTNETGTLTASGKITGPNGFTLLCNSIGGTSLGVTLSNTANDYAGDTIINQSAVVGKTYTLILGAANVIPNGAGKGNVTITTNGTGVGRLNLGGFSETINGLSGNGTVDGISGTPTLTVGDNNASSSFTGTLVNAAGSLALTKVGSGTLTLAGANSHTGATTVSGGTLAITGAPTGTGATMVNGGTLAISGSPTGNSAITLNGGNLTLDYTINTSKIHDSSILTLNGGSVTLAGATGDHVELVDSTSLSGGVTLNRSGANTAKLALGTITRGSGGALDVAELNLATTANANNGGGYLTGITLAGGLAMNDGSGNIVAYTGSFADVTRLDGSITDGAGTQVRIINGGTTNNINLAAAGTTTVSTLTNASTDGPATIDIASGRVLRLGAQGSILSPSTSLGLTLNGPGTLTAGGADDTAGDLLVLNQSVVDTNIGAVIANNGSGAVSLTKYGSGALNLTGANTFTGGVRLNEGSIVAQVTATQNALGTGAVTVSGGTTLALNNTNTSVANLNVSNVFSGGGTLQTRFADAGTARNTFFNGTTPLANFTGTIRLSLASGATTTADKWNAAGLGTIPGSLVIDSGTQFLAASGTTTFSSGITVSGTGNTENRGAIRLIGTVGGNIILAGDTTIGTEGGTLSGNIASGTAGTQTLTFGSAGSTGNATLSGVIGGGTGTINLVKTKTGTVTLSGANSFTGTVWLNDGILLSSNAAGLGAATQITVENSDSSGNNNNNLQLGGGTTQGAGAVLTLYNSATSGTVSNARVSLENQSGSNTWAGGIVFRGGSTQALTNSVASTTLTINGAISQHGSEPTTGIFVRGSSNGVINGNISLGSAIVTKTDSGTWTIGSSGNTWGNTGVAVGTLKMGAANALPATTTVTMGQGDTQGATLDLNGFSQTVTGLAFSSTGGTKQITSSAAATFTVDAAGANSYGGVLAGAGLALSKSGAGTLTLSGANTYGGMTTINGGTLQIGNAGTTGTPGSAAITNNATLAFNRTNAITVGNVINGSGALAQNGAGTLSLTGVNTYTGNTTVSAGTLTLADNARLTFAIGNASGVSNSLTGAGSATLAGDFAIDLTAASALSSGTWVLENVASLTGAYDSTFQVVDTAGTPWTDEGDDTWTKLVGDQTWTFNETDGTLTLASSAYDSWASVIPNAADRDRTDDPDGDGFTNLHEFLFGTSPIAGNGSLVTTSTSGSNLVLRWLQLESGATYTLTENSTLSGSWTTVVSPVPALDGNQSGAPADYDYYTVTLPTGAGKNFFRIEGVEN